MKTALFVILLAISVAAQESPASPGAQSACGPAEAQFDAERSAGQQAAQLDLSKAVVYVVEDFRKAPGELGNPTIRIGVDGAWKGATRANTYVSFPVEPGDHHLCVNWQSREKRLSKLAAFARLEAEPGKTYYFRARITYSSYGGLGANMNLDLERVDPDQGEHIVASYTPSLSHVKQ